MVNYLLEVLVDSNCCSWFREASAPWLCDQKFQVPFRVIVSLFSIFSKLKTKSTVIVMVVLSRSVSLLGTLHGLQVGHEVPWMKWESHECMHNLPQFPYI